MKRREFITLLGGAAAAWPLAARAQQGDRVRRIGVFMGIANDSEGQDRMAIFVKTLEDLGWRESHSVQLDYRWAPRDAAQARVFAEELVGLKPDMIFCLFHSSDDGGQRRHANDTGALCPSIRSRRCWTGSKLGKTRRQPDRICDFRTLTVG